MPLHFDCRGREPPGRGAHNRTRTDDLFLTKEVLCQLSYVGPGPIAMLLVGREGIEPPQPKAAGLQPAELTTCSTYPLWRRPPRRDCGLWVSRHRKCSLLEPTTGLEPGTCGLQNRCSTN